MSLLLQLSSLCSKKCHIERTETGHKTMKVRNLQLAISFDRSIYSLLASLLSIA